MTTNYIIETKNLTKKYDKLTAVDSLNLKIKAGEIYGLLGPNGAGKTTTILMMLGLSEPTDGEVFIDGYNSTTEPIKVKRIAGYLPDNIGFYEDLTGRENLRFIAELNGLPNKDLDERIDSVLKRVGLLDVGDKNVGAYSRGMRQRLGIADILIKNPKIVIFDEPTLGLDPEGIEDILNLISDLSRKDGRTVLISSHLLYQIQKICDRVGIFVKGKLLASGPIESLGAQVFDQESFILELKADDEGDRLFNIINSIQGVDEVTKENNKIIIKSEIDIRKKLMKEMYENNFTILHLKLLERELDDIYKKYFEKKEGLHEALHV
ncbi:ABC transporter ATP-binding protein [Paramaledivibacter caminithermalis]|jgi:ABC-2 type transport system ATP-binding protein|uniref:ABC-2 type transport system ATP-binding protein n=1 Tax=Paramaledivibacter caminithermalis (strain DSM 15212 / CIP 107654 / DViRD3) TaxID=1121301 RepID=A0A1M6MDB1_PARC5|nr:ABC transporter ATP-binding protein [Paramaledivibacter caminithermalis]SHJ81399.1 ABC-2 type transport system ATP-binding protein [Paramaledivibacter caminithermalis DSM 15212]